jgi:serine/threonine-protein kinase
MDTMIGADLRAYRVGILLGRGPAGEVHRAIPRRPGRRVALKIVEAARSGDRASLQRLVRDADRAAGLRHPHILPVFDSGIEGSVGFVAMLPIDTGDLRALLRWEAPLAPARAVALLEQAAAGLDAAHAQGLVHGNVKPSNLLVDRRGAGEHVFVSDFGTAREILLDGETPPPPADALRYLAPEAAGGAPGPAADVYSLGCILYEALTGSVPFLGDDPVAVLEAHRTGPRPRVTAAAPDLPPEIDEVIERATAVEPSDRYASCGEMAAAARVAFGPRRAPGPAAAARRNQPDVAVDGSGTVSDPAPKIDEETVTPAADQPEEPDRVAPAIWASREGPRRRPIEDHHAGWDPYARYWTRRALRGVLTGALLVGAIAFLAVMWLKTSNSTERQPQSVGGALPSAVRTSPSPSPSPTRSPSPSPSATTSPSPPASPSPPDLEGLTVLVRNGAGVNLLATRTSEILEAAGISVATSDNAPTTLVTTIYYQSDWEEQARYLHDLFFPTARVLPGLEPTDEGVQIVVFLGSDYVEPTAPSPSP